MIRIIINLTHTLNLSLPRILPLFPCPPSEASHNFKWTNSAQLFQREIDTHLGGALGHLGLIVSDAADAMVAPATAAGPTIWVKPRARHTPGMWLHKTRPIAFSLIVDDFVVKYGGQQHAHHLRNAFGWPLCLLPFGL
jgi:hypothetical protein